MHGINILPPIGLHVLHVRIYYSMVRYPSIRNKEKETDIHRVCITSANSINPRSCLELLGPKLLDPYTSRAGSGQLPREPGSLHVYQSFYKPRNLARNLELPDTPFLAKFKCSKPCSITCYKRMLSPTIEEYFCLVKSHDLKSSKLQETTTLRARLSENTTLHFFDKNHHVYDNIFVNNTNRRIRAL